MASQGRSLLKAGLLVLLAAQILPPASGCNQRHYEVMIGEFCQAKFRLDMTGLERNAWCSWPKTMKIYEELTNCTHQVALKMDCFWPNGVVDDFFMQIHRDYFSDCALTGRLPHDPPIGILAPFIAVPVLITLLMTAAVVWRSKRTEGVL
ncbi:Receptor activity-modifying protein 1 [Oryzias melastigma]|uniref:Receptor activity-modifying protein 1 n=1 Tax=Oryzias melastigma TaxID=30732 RepID=A0A834C3M9_ORYME|nr:receptor activity-modifying protein 1 [Oryzias melastigma]KAF6722232.1 Receptor activity-modifying protein 1 [Oryzias melastigma]